MTVGISFTNGVEAIVITDSRISGPSRQSDSVNKLGEFNKEAYHGFIVGSGSSYIVQGLYVRLISCQGESLDSYVAEVQSKIGSKVRELRQGNLQVQKDELLEKANLVLDEADRKKFLEQGTIRLLQEFDKLKEDPITQTRFILTAYDKESKRARHFYIDAAQWVEQFSADYETGSGLDGAHFYFAGVLQGLDTRKLSSNALLFHAINAYAQASLNIGVGGTPQIARVSSEGNKVLSVEQARVLTNVSGAYTSRYTPHLTPDRMKRYCGEVLQGKRTSFANIARMLNTTPDSLTTMAIPYSVWQERANSR